jgi:pimeloyl-ACP methyl ester carboxylesterase
MELFFRKFGEKGAHVILLHGLLGSSDNLQTAAKALSQQYTVWVPDLRNHGRSPHDIEINYPLLSEDLLQFLDAHLIDKAHIFGHSMGGKVAMTFGLKYPERTHSLLIGDIAPMPYEGDHVRIFEVMLTLPLTELTSREMAYEMIAKTIHSEVLRQFILKNLARNEQGFYWRPAVEILWRNYRLLMDFSPGGKVFQGPVAFIRGGLSDYILPQDFPYYETIFPLAELITLPNAGHWIHADQPELFLKTITDFIDKVEQENY